MRRIGLIAFIAAVVVAISTASHAGSACRGEIDIVESYHHMLGRSVEPWRTSAEPAAILQWIDLTPARARDVCDLMQTRRPETDLVAGADTQPGAELQEGRAVEGRP